ncbi:MAG: radical SAM family heme chaperone HemW [Elusimicrobia bacterium]|nr:radical SAM family heme chaperone HemW [Elusimicrobiota bacterium]
MGPLLATHTGQDHPVTAGLYLHLPFCRVRCPFCDFVVVTRQQDKMKRYLAAMVREMERYRGLSLRTVYLGGGTPSTIAGSQLKWLMDQVCQRFVIEPNPEVTLEANPEDITVASLYAWKAAGINRLSLGVQTFHDRLLHRIARASPGDAEKRGVAWMYGLPGQTQEDWQHDVETAVGLGSEHLSLYALTIEPGTAFGRHAVSVNEDLQAEMYTWAMERLPACGYEQYELSNFAKPGYPSRHNLVYWRSEPYLGIGVGAWSFLKGVRYRNIETFSEYLCAVETRGTAWNEEDHLPPERRAREALILALRLSEGVPEKQMDTAATQTLTRFERYGLVERTWIEGTKTENRYRLTASGRRLSNQVFCELVL